MLLGIDVGGTFTDAVIIDGGTIVSSAKRRTTKENLMNGITDALGAVMSGPCTNRTGNAIHYGSDKYNCGA